MMGGLLIATLWKYRLNKWLNQMCIETLKSSDFGRSSVVFQFVTALVSSGEP